VRLDTIYLPTVTSVCFGINAPAVLVRPIVALVLPLLRLPFASWADRFALDEIPFLLVVAALWYLVGKWLVALRDAGRDPSQRNPSGKLSTHLSIAIVGILLLYMGVDSLLHLGRWNNPFGNTVEGSLSLVWAITLLSASVRKLFGKKGTEAHDEDH